MTDPIEVSADGGNAVRRQRVLLVGVAVVAAGAAVWLFLHPLDPLAVEADQVRRVEVRFEPWGEDMVRQAGATSEDREVIALLVAVIRSGQETRDHKCGSRGVILFERSVGSAAELHFLPGHDPAWYEFRTGGRVFRVPRAEFVAAMRRVGVEVPLEC